MSQGLAIGLIETEKEKQTVKVDFQISEMKTLEEYKRAYEDSYGKEIDLGILVNALAIKALTTDRGFKAWKKEQAKVSQAKSTATYNS
tara:strand:- start:265 stop:528 length:264 start_codon:yes stop_codon:yes gene_type:complete